MPINAHPAFQRNILQSEGGYVGGEKIGWIIDEGYHTNGTKLYYKFDFNDPYLTSQIIQNVRRGAALWTSYGSVIESSSASGVVDTFDAKTTKVIAMFHDFYSDTSGHLTAWKISYNRLNTPIIDLTGTSKTAVYMAHEFGHAYGLRDLYNSYNYTRLMYGDTGHHTAMAPTADDIKGFNVITGQHTSHSFNSSGVCTNCGGLKK